MRFDFVTYFASRQINTAFRQELHRVVITIQFWIRVGRIVCQHTNERLKCITARTKGASLMLLPTVHVPSGINPLTISQDEDFGDAACTIDAFPSDFQFICISRVEHGGRAVHLNLSLWKLELDELPAALCEVYRIGQYLLAI